MRYAINRSDKSYNFFLKLNTKPYIDQWIAIVDNKVVAHGKKIKIVLNEIERKHLKDTPLITKIPGEETMIL